MTEVRGAPARKHISDKRAVDKRAEERKDKNPRSLGARPLGVGRAMVRPAGGPPKKPG